MAIDMRSIAIGLGSLACCLAGICPAAAQVQLQAGASNYAIAEAGRQDAVRRQVQLNDRLRWQAGLPPANGVFYYPVPPSLDSAYALGPFYGESGWGYGTPGRGIASRDIFTPWPYVPGDIWGYQQIPTGRQSIGQVEIQTGPNRWESFPVYARPAIAPPLVVDFPVDSEPPPAEAPRSGPREF